MAKAVRNPRRYNKRVEILRQKQSTRDAGGNFVQQWEVVARRWASVKPLGGFEFERGEQVHAQAQFRIRIPSDNLTRSLTPKHAIRLTSNKNIYQVSFAEDEDMANKEMVFQASLLVGE